MDRYTHKIYDMARFHVPEGLYSIAELEQMLADFKEAKRVQDDQLRATAQLVCHALADAEILRERRTHAPPEL